MTNESENIADLLPRLRSNLNATELILGKFSSAARTQILKQSMQAKRVGITLDTNVADKLIITIQTMQTDFTKLKSNADIMLTFFESLPK